MLVGERLKPRLRIRIVDGALAVLIVYHIEVLLKEHEPLVEQWVLSDPICVLLNEHVHVQICLSRRANEFQISHVLCKDVVDEHPHHDLPALSHVDVLIELTLLGEEEVRQLVGKQAVDAFVGIRDGFKLGSLGDLFESLKIGSRAVQVAVKVAAVALVDQLVEASLFWRGLNLLVEMCLHGFAGLLVVVV